MAPDTGRAGARLRAAAVRPLSAGSGVDLHRAGDDGPATDDCAGDHGRARATTTAGPPVTTGRAAATTTTLQPTTTLAPTTTVAPTTTTVAPTTSTTGPGTSTTLVAGRDS